MLQCCWAGLHWSLVSSSRPHLPDWLVVFHGEETCQLFLLHKDQFLSAGQVGVGLTGHWVRIVLLSQGPRPLPLCPSHRWQSGAAPASAAQCAPATLSPAGRDPEPALPFTLSAQTSLMPMPILDATGGEPLGSCGAPPDAQPRSEPGHDAWQAVP